MLTASLFRVAKTILLSMVVFFPVLACKKHDKPIINVDVAADILLVDQQGNCLITPASINDITLYSINSGIRKPIVSESLGYPKSFKIFQEPNSNNYILRILPPVEADSELAKILIEYSPSVVDTMEFYYARAKSSVICTSVLYNGTKVWDTKTASPTSYNGRVFKIVK